MVATSIWFGARREKPDDEAPPDLRCTRGVPLRPFFGRPIWLQLRGAHCAYTMVQHPREPEVSTTKGVTKGDRLYIRASTAEKAKLERAAQLLHTSRSQFVLRQALDAAERVLSEQTQFVLSEDLWTAFCERLDAPEKERPNIKALATEPSPFHGR